MQKYIRTEQGVFDIEKEVKKVLDSVIEEVNFSYQFNLECARNESEYHDLKEKLKEEIDGIKVKVDFNEYFYVYVEASFTDRDNDFGKIIKSSDFIEELCDEFVLLDKELNHRHIVTSPKGFMPSKDYELYGAIWIDGDHDEPILKSVARINEKGELELL